MKWRTVFVGVLLGALAVFLGWRMLYPPRYIEVSDWFARPIATVGASQPSFDLSAQACGACHTDIAHEASQTMHAKVWTDAVFLADWRRGGANPVCRNCHTPLDRQQELLALGSPDGDRWTPTPTPNPAFDPALRQEGIACAACHVRDGKVFGPWANLAAPHPTAAWANPNEACIRCHLAANTSRDSFLRQPPCGTIAEIEPARPQKTAAAREPSDDGYLQTSPIANPAALRCVECHMPSIDRPLTPGGQVRPARRHLWLGAHDPATIRAALTIGFARTSEPSGETRVALTIANTGANHDVPTGPADRRLTVTLQVLDAAGKPLQTQEFTLERKVLGRPFLVDLWDTRLLPNRPQDFSLTVPAGGKGAAVEAVVRYGLMDSSHRDHIGYREPIFEEIFRQRILIVEPVAHSG